MRVSLRVRRLPVPHCASTMRARLPPDTADHLDAAFPDETAVYMEALAIHRAQVAAAGLA